MLPREAVLCLVEAGPGVGAATAEADAAANAAEAQAQAQAETDRRVQLAAVLAVGSRAVWPADCRPLWDRLPHAARERVALAQHWQGDAVVFDAVLHHGPASRRPALLQQLAARPGPIIGLTALAAADHAVPLERLVIERSLSINTAAAGGNASLMTIG